MARTKGSKNKSKTVYHAVTTAPEKFVASTFKLDSSLYNLLPKPQTGTELEGVRLKVFLDRYSNKDEKGHPTENYPEDIWRRVAVGLASVETIPEKRAFWVKKFYSALQDFKFVPAGRILSGAGTGYEVTFYNCFVIPSPHDSRGGIIDNLKTMVEIMSRSGGVGINLSSLRPRGARVKKVNGTASGPVNWAELYSVATHDVIQQGGSRRGALMLMINDWHPDIEEFITVKQDLNRINGANLSVCISDSFMQAVKEDLDWNLVYPDTKDPEYDKLWNGDLKKWLSLGKKVETYRTLKARYLWDLIAQAAWRSAEPGVVFIERYNKLSNTWYYENIISVNPCVTGDTLVATEKGWIPVRDLGVGTKIATPLGLKPVEKIYNNGVQNIFKVSFSDGGELKATADHQLKIVKGKKYEWVKVSDLEVGDKVVVVDQTYFQGEEKVKVSEEVKQYAEANNILLNNVSDKDLGFLIGVTIGDGYFGKIGKKLGYRMKIAVGRNEGLWKNVLEEKLTQFGISPKFQRVEHQVRLSNNTVINHGSDQITLYKLASFLGLLGLEPKTGHNKTIPSAFFNLGLEFQKGLLDGLFCTDGSISLKAENPLLRLSSSSHTLLGQVRLLLLNFGIHSRIYKTNRKETIYDNRKLTGTGIKYDLIIMNEGIAKFYKEIGLTHPDKAERLKKVTDEYYFIGGTNLATVQEILDTKISEEVFDVYEPNTLTWVTNGYVSLDCGEQGLPAWGVCNLGAMNLAAFVKSGEFDYESLSENTKIAMRMLDNVIDANYYFYEENERQQKSTRRTGLGTMGLGDALIKLKLRYGSEESLTVIEKIYQTIRDAAYEASSEIASEKGSFPMFDREKYLQGWFIKRLPLQTQQQIAMQGIRNAVLLTQAPTGTTSLLSGVSSGIEPVYDFAFVRRDRMGEHVLYHPLYQEWKDSHVGEEAPDYFVSANDLTPEDHVRVQAAIQKFTDSSISKTVNAPNSHAVEDVKKLYDLAYELGCKGVTYMRDGSRAGVLSHIEEKKETAKEASPETQPKVDLPAPVELRTRPDILLGASYRVKTPVGTAFITINTDENGAPFEMFINVGKAGSDITADAEAIGRLISLVFRIPSPYSPRAVAEQLVLQLRGIGGSESLGFGNGRIRSLADAVAKVIEDHLRGIEETPVTTSIVQEPLNFEAPKPEGVLKKDICPTCGQATLVYEEGCGKCYNCGFAKC